MAQKMKKSDPLVETMKHIEKVGTYNSRALRLELFGYLVCRLLLEKKTDLYSRTLLDNTFFFLSSPAVPFPILLVLTCMLR